jgi:hypothetical protein
LPELLTQEDLNGRFWNTMTSEQQDYFVLGYPLMGIDWQSDSL